MKAILLRLFVCLLVGKVAPHGHIQKPLARTSIQTDPSYGTDEPYFWEHQGVWCDNVHQDLAVSMCGRCGEKLGNWDASQDGIYDKKRITGNYTAGEVIDIEAQFVAHHFGYYYLELCPFERETDDCFIHMLQIVSGTEDIRDGNKLCVGGRDNSIAFCKVKLPDGVSCSRCTLRWTYRTSYYRDDPNWERCSNPDLTQVFRNCVDISIAPSNEPTPQPTTTSTTTTPPTITAGTTSITSAPTTPSGGICPDDSVFWPHENCTLFYICVSCGSPLVHSCPPFTFYNPTLGHCDAPQNVPQCAGGTRPTTPKPVSCPPQGVRKVAHPTRCDAFYICINGNPDPSFYLCPEGNYFQEETETCVSQSLVDCPFI